MMLSSTERLALSGSASAASLGLSFTKITVSTKPIRHNTVAPANAIFTPKMPACTGSVAPALMFVAIEEMETSSAVPNDPATWRRVLFTEVPWFMRLLSSAFMAHVVMGMFTSESENMRTVYRMVR